MVPIAMINIIQVLYNAIDVAILGNFTGDDTVAAVGATSVLVFLLNALVNGLSSGINIIVARCVGSGEEDRARQATGTAFLTAIISSICAAAVLIPFAPTLLTWLNCDPLVLDASATYLRLFLCSIPFQWIYIFLAAAIRATGNSSRPMAIMLISGGCKVVFNLIFVGLFRMGIVGTGLSTILIQMIAATLAFFTISRNRSAYYTLERKNVRIRGSILLDMVRFGVPASLSSTCFYIANAVIQSSLNSMGKAATTANAVSTQWDSFIYNAGIGVATATMAFISQNIGAGKYDRVKKVLWIAIALVTVITLSIGTVIAIFADQLCGITTDSPEIIELAKERLILYCFTYFIPCMMEVVASSLIAMGHTRNHLFVSLAVGLGFRIFWATTIWPMFGTMRALFTVVPVSCAICLVEYFIVLSFALPRLKQRLSGAGRPVSAE